MKATSFLALAALGLLAAGCNKNLSSTRAFHLPAGNAADGQAAFLSLGCVRCHSVHGVDLPKPTAEPAKVLALGGPVVRLRTYGDLMTAIIHPNYSLSDTLPVRERKQMGKSPMEGCNDVMTVRQLIDLVAFLQPRYQQLEPLYEMEYQLLP